MRRSGGSLFAAPDPRLPQGPQHAPAHLFARPSQVPDEARRRPRGREVRAHLLGRSSQDRRRKTRTHGEDLRQRVALLAVLLRAAVARQFAPRLVASSQPHGRLPQVLRLLFDRPDFRFLPDDLRRKPRFLRKRSRQRQALRGFRQQSVGDARLGRRQVLSAHLRALGPKPPEDDHHRPDLHRHGGRQGRRMDPDPSGHRRSPRAGDRL